MATSLKELRKQIDPGVQREARAKAVHMLAEMSLAEARKSRSISQQLIAKVRGLVKTNGAAANEKGDDHLTTLAQYIEGLGGVLEIQATFPDGLVVKINVPSRIEK